MTALFKDKIYFIFLSENGEEEKKKDIEKY